LGRVGKAQLAEFKEQSTAEITAFLTDWIQAKRAEKGIA